MRAAAGARGLLGQTDARDLRRGIGASRHGGLVEGMNAFDAGDLLHAQHALVACLMREPGRTDHIADSIEAGDAGAAPFVDDDMALVDLDALRLETEPFDIAGDADGEDDAVDCELSRSAPRLRQRAVTLSSWRVSPSTVVPVWMVDALLGEGLACERGDLGILHRENAGEHLDHRHLGAERCGRSSRTRCRWRQSRSSSSDLGKLVGTMACL